MTPTAHSPSRRPRHTNGINLWVGCVRWVCWLLWLPGVLACAAVPDPAAPPPASALQFFQRGNEAYQAEDFATAVYQYNRALALDTRPAEFHYNLGVALYQIGDYDRAVTAFNAALERDPRLNEAYYNLALAHYALYDLTAAHSHYNTYVRLAGGTGTEQTQQDRSGDSGGAPGLGGPNPNAARTTPAQRTRQELGIATGNDPGGRRDQNPFEGNPEWWKEELPRQ